MSVLKECWWPSKVPYYRRSGGAKARGRGCRQVKGGGGCTWCARPQWDPDWGTDRGSYQSEPAAAPLSRLNLWDLRQNMAWFHCSPHIIHSLQWTAFKFNTILKLSHAKRLFSDSFILRYSKIFDWNCFLNFGVGEMTPSMCDIKAASHCTTGDKEMDVLPNGPHHIRQLWPGVQLIGQLPRDITNHSHNSNVILKHPPTSVLFPRFFRWYL